MPRLRRLPLTLAVAAGALIAATAGAPPALAEGLTEAEKAQVRDLIRDTLLENPEIVMEAVSVLRARQAEREQAAAQAALKQNAEALFRDDADPVLGNPKGDVTVVEFFDYQCGYCKRVFGPVMDTIAADGNVRLVLKELPILGPESVLAARWSLAADKQERYKAFHSALMGHRGAITEAVLRQYAKDAGMDVEQAARDAQDPAVEDALRKTMALAAQLGIGGTPAFVIGDQLIPGALDADTLKEAIASARSKG